MTHRSAAGGSVSCDSRSSRNRDTSSDSSRERPGASPSQNGMVGGAPVRIDDADLAPAHMQDLPRRIPQQKHVAPHALDSEILIQRADDRFLRLGHDAVLAGLGNRTGVGDRRQAGPLRACSRRPTWS